MFRYTVFWGVAWSLCLSLLSAGVSLEEKIGQMLIVGFKGDNIENVSPYIIEGIKKYNIGGVILFDIRNGNVKSPKQLAELTKDLQGLSKVPLFIAVDQEGGAVARLSKQAGFPGTLSAGEIGRFDDSDFTFLQSTNIAKTLKAAGINLNFAPVVDLTYEDNFISINGRTFSADANEVIQHASQFIAGHKRYGIATCLKHFPGHGSSVDDSHKGMVDVTDSWFPGELIPYRTLIKEDKATFIMSAHIYQRRLDPDYPASLSYNMLTKLLREQLAYKGLIITDDLQMGAIVKEFSWDEALLQAIRAGNDMLLICNTQEDAYDEEIISKSVDLIKKGIETGKLDSSMIEESYRRIKYVKQRLLN